MQNHSKKLVVVLGPTGVGKTAISIKLAKKYNTPIISVDSRQFFREMKIGTAAPNAEQLSAVRHFFVGHKSINERYSCGMYELDALRTLDEIFKESYLSLMVGGSMLYIDAVCKGIDDFPTPDAELRKNLQRQLQEEGIESLRSQLKILDPQQYKSIDLKNPQRILKAVEVSIQTGKPYSSYLTQPSRKRPFEVIKIGLNRPREELYNIINQRVDDMVVAGLVNEVKGLTEFKHHNALKTVGYREIFDYLDGKQTLEQAVELIKRNSRRYAKRQLTWWARDSDIEWFHPEDEENIVNYIEKKIAPSI